MKYDDIPGHQTRHHLSQQRGFPRFFTFNMFRDYF